MRNQSIMIPLIQLTLALIVSALLIIGNACAAADEATLFSSWQVSLSKYVNNQGLVNYAEWKANCRELDQFIQSLPHITSTDYNSMTRDEKLELNDFSLSYLNYDWTLNDAGGGK